MNAAHGCPTLKFCLAFACAFLGVATAPAGRHESFTAKFATGPKMIPQAATFFGGNSADEFVEACVLPDGVIVAFGNSAGPAFPESPKPVILGRGKHQGLDPLPASGKEGPLFSRENPDLAGMIVRFSPDLRAVIGVTRFDWGVASFSTGVVSRDGKALLVAGRCTAAFRGLGPMVKVLDVPQADEAPAPGRKAPATPVRGPYRYGNVTAPGDVFVARMTPDGSRIEWAWVLPGFRNPPGQMWSDRQGALYVSANGMWRISAEGGKPERINPVMDGRTAQYHLVDPGDGAQYFGGDRNTNTGYQPYRQPYLYKYDAKGTKLWKMWEPNPKSVACGGPGNGLCSDSSVRAMEWASNGDLLVAGWSDGGNSVFGRQPNDMGRAAGPGAMGMSAWGMKNANSLAYVLRIDPKTAEQTAWTLWLSFLPDNFVDSKSRGAPNFASIRGVKGLVDNSIAIVGSAATGLPQTPGALFGAPADGSKYGGQFVAVLTPAMDNAMYSSYLPGIEEAGIAPGKTGLLVFGRAGAPSETGTANLTLHPVQAARRGVTDAWIAWVAPAR